MIKAVIDANVIISAVIAPLGASRRILEAWRAGAFVLVTSPSVIDEVSRRLWHPRIRDRYDVTDEDRAKVLALLRSSAEVQPGARQIAGGSRDPSDDMILATALESGAGLIVTGDKDLLEMESYEQTKIVTPGPIRGVTDNVAIAIIIPP